MEINFESIDFQTLTIKDVNGNTQEHNVLDELKINEYNLNAEMQRQPQLYVYYTSILEKLRAYQESADLNLESTHARLYEPSRQVLIEQGTPKPTKDQIESAIINTTDYQQAKAQVNSYNHLVKRLQYIVKAFEQRKDMLIQLATNRRKEEEYQNALKNV